MTLADDGHRTVVSVVECPGCGADLRDMQQAVHIGKCRELQEALR